MTESKPRGSIDIMHEEFIKKALIKANDNRKLTAALLGITERTLYRKMNKYGLPTRKKND